VRKNLEQVKKAGNRAKDLVSQILTFSRTEQYKDDAVDIAPIIREALKLLRATIPSSIAIDYDIPDGHGKVMTDPTKIYQVLMNLCTNAAHAMRNKEGQLTLTLNRVDGGDPFLSGTDNEGKQWLRLSVQDTGTGIPQELVNRIFDPYFTTKDKGEGTGLGLSVVHGIVRASGGVIKVDSCLGRGSTFHLFFPIADEGREVSVESSLQMMMGGSERILFVDDEATLAEMTGEMLEQLGYSVTIRSSSRAALELFTSFPGGFDLLITDQTMPEMSGMDLAARILSIRPDIPVILYTGYSAAIDGAEAHRLGIRKFLMKPLSMKVLSEAVRRTLDSP
jgi:CheY-like chemotaxis protein/two-component sensor histidine kinase